MGRSVSVPCGAEYVEYAALDLNSRSCGNCSKTFDEYAKRKAKPEEPEYAEGVSDCEAGCCPHCGEHHSNTYYRDPSDDFDWFVDDYRSELTSAFKSVSPCDEWLDREDHAVAENRYAYFGVSEYCGLVAMWVKPKDASYYDEHGWENLRDRWLAQIGPKFKRIANTCFGQALQKLGTFSNGEAFFQPANGQQHGSLGLGFSSKEGWL